MRHISCDLCGKDMTSDSDPRHCVRMELFTAVSDVAVTESDLDQDHLDSMAEYLQQLEELGEECEPEATCKKHEYDLCPSCFRRFSADPLGRERARKLRFSKN